MYKHIECCNDKYKTVLCFISQDNSQTMYSGSKVATDGLTNHRNKIINNLLIVIFIL